MEYKFTGLVKKCASKCGIEETNAPIIAVD